MVLSLLPAFVFDGCEVAECAVQPFAVVEDLDELEDGSASVGTRRPGLAVDELLFERREPALGHGVVPALTRSRQRLGDAVGPEELAELLRGVLGPAVGIKPISV